MNTLMIVVLSVLATLSVVFLVWTVDGLRKAHKFHQTNNEKINSLDATMTLHIQEIHHRLDNEFRSQNETLTNIESALQNDIRRHNEDLRLDSIKSYEELNQEIVKMYSDIDRRFDKIYSKLYEMFPQLKEKNKIEQINS